MKGYQELKDILVADNLAMGGGAWSEWQDGYWWAGKVILRVAATQAFDVLIQRRGSDGSLGAEILANSISELPPADCRHETDFICDVGMSFRIGIKNNGGATTSFRVSATLVE